MRNRLVSKRNLVLLAAFSSILGSILFLLACEAAPTPKEAKVPPLPEVGQGVNVTVDVSKPKNGTHLVAGETAAVTVTLKDSQGKPATKDDFTTLGLYMYGPQETTQTVTAVKLLNATTDRTATPHHYIDLLTNKDVQLKGNVLTYTLQPVSNEAPGTYTVSLRVQSKEGNSFQAFKLKDVQIGTATVEKQIVEKEKCASCHLGANTKQFYFAHTDPGRSPYGSPSLDSIPVRTCKSCHNNEGYAAFTNPFTKQRVPDQIVNRVHGVHNGKQLENPINIGDHEAKVEGIFADYVNVKFPADIRNCAACHVDDRWQTKPSRLACGTCHDNIDWTTGKSVVKGEKDHGGGPQANDSACNACHGPSGIQPVAKAHKIEHPMNEVSFSMTPPSNGKFYRAGDKPVVTIVIKDDDGKPIADHTKVNRDSFSVASFFVYGPRSASVPVLTSTAVNEFLTYKASVQNAKAAAGTDTKGWTFASGDTFKIGIDGAKPVEITAPAGLQTPAQVKDWLSSQLNGVTVTSTATNVRITSNTAGAKSSIDIYSSKVDTTMNWKGNGVTAEPATTISASSFPKNDLRDLPDPLAFNEARDPKVTRSVANIAYQLNDVANLKPGTYMMYAYTIPTGVLAGTATVEGPTGTPTAAAKALNSSHTAIGFTTFQVGTATEEKKVATNCADCHKDTIWHLHEGPIHAEPFDPDYCKACHDYNRPGTGNDFRNQGGTSSSGWSGYGAVPIVRRVHGVHYGAYLELPEQIYANASHWEQAIFPQDIRNCTKCHDAATTSAQWKEKPSRLACNSCHDTGKGLGHTGLMTSDPTPKDKFGSDSVEPCLGCHGPGMALAPDQVHKLTDPYVPPYLREPRHGYQEREE